jgi:hypothetical protein
MTTNCCHKNRCNCDKKKVMGYASGRGAEIYWIYLKPHGRGKAEAGLIGRVDFFPPGEDLSELDHIRLFFFKEFANKLQ